MESPVQVTSVREAYKYLILREFSMKQRVRNGFAILLNRYPWEWFVTFTFTEDIHIEAAKKSLRVWLAKLNQHLYGKRWYKKPPFGVYWACATEYQKRGVVHFHLLIAGVKDAHRLTFLDIWKNMGGKNGFGQIEDVKSNGGTSSYLSKYAAKDADIDFSNNLPDVTAGFEQIWSDSAKTSIESEVSWVMPKLR